MILRGHADGPDSKGDCCAPGSLLSSPSVNKYAVGFLLVVLACLTGPRTSLAQCTT